MVLVGCGEKKENEAEKKSDNPAGMKSHRVPLKGDIASVRPPKDTDGDGVPDSEDKCPTVKGVKSEKGCPAKKEPPPQLLGVVAPVRKPMQEGSKLPVTSKDTDGDGVPDSRDRCPKRKGPASNKGCPRLPGGRVRPAPVPMK